MKMLRSACALLLVTALFKPEPASAQTVIGAKAGLNIATLSTDSDLDLDSRTSFAGGGFATIGLGDVLFVQPEVLYSMKGAKIPIDGEDGTWKLDYLEIPLLFGAAFQLDDSNVTPRVFAGPVVAFELACKLEGSESGVSASIDCDDTDQIIGFDIDTKTVDFGLAFGAGIGIELSSLMIILDGRYNLGLTNLNDVEGASGDIKNRAWQFMAGVGFPVGG